MKVKELRKLLENIDQEMDVCVSGESWVSTKIEMAGIYSGKYLRQYDGPKLIYRLDETEGTFLLIGDWGDYVDEDNYTEMLLPDIDD